MSWQLQVYFYLDLQPNLYCWEFSSQQAAINAGNFFTSLAGPESLIFTVTEDPITPAPAFTVVTGSTVGKSLAVQTSAGGSSVSSVLDNTAYDAPTIMVINRGANDVWVRISPEAAPVATQNDTLVFANSVQLFTNPVPMGQCGVAVYISVSTSQIVYFVPGE
jgi:hypothetical protein